MRQKHSSIRRLGFRKYFYEDKGNLKNPAQRMCELEGHRNPFYHLVAIDFFDVWSCGLLVSQGRTGSPRL